MCNRIKFRHFIVYRDKHFERLTEGSSHNFRTLLRLNIYKRRRKDEFSINKKYISILT